MLTYTLLIHADNFHLLPQGGPASEPRYIIQRFNNPNQRLHAESSAATQQDDIPTTSGDTIWVAEFGPSRSSQFGLMFHTTIGAGTSNEQKWYLRADGLGGSANLVRSDHVRLKS